MKMSCAVSARGRIDAAAPQASPLPLAGEGQGEGILAPIFPPTLSPPLPRKRGREQTAPDRQFVPQAGDRI